MVKLTPKDESGQLITMAQDAARRHMLFGYDQRTDTLITYQPPENMAEDWASMIEAVKAKQKEWAEEQWDAESAWRDAESARRCGGDGVAAQEGKIQRVRGVAAGGAGGVHPAQA